MAILALISTETMNDLQSLGDIVGVFPDTWQFSPTEIEKFDFLTLNGTVEVVEDALKEITPDTAIALHYAIANEYHFNEPLPGVDSIDGKIDVWRPVRSNKWYELVNDFKLPFNVGTLTQEEKDILATFDLSHPSAQAALNKIAKELADDPANQNEIVELKNTNP